MRRGIVLLGGLLCVLATPLGVMGQVYLDPDVTTGSFMADGEQIGFHRAAGILPDTADYDWWYGCSPTSAGMMMGYYDRNGYDGVSYDNLVPGGVAESSSYGGGGLGLLCNQIIASAGHIADFWVGYGQSGNDPLGGARTIPDDFDSLADFMGTSQDSCGNLDGGTTFYFYGSGAEFHDYNAVTHGIQDLDGMYGIGEYVDFATYDTVNLYTQLIPHAFGDYYGNTDGATLDDFKAEIDAGRPVLIHIEGHTMCGYGYNDADPNTLYVYDTWYPGTHTLTWGGSYGGLPQWGVTCVELVPEPTSLGLLAIGLLAVLRRRAA